MVPTTANLTPGFLSVSFFKAGSRLVSLMSYGVSTGLVLVKMIALFIAHVQYLAETLLTNIRRGKHQ